MANKMHYTMNPVPSDNPCDAEDNARAIDEFTNTEENFFTDRRKQKRLSITGISEYADPGMAAKFAQQAEASAEAAASMISNRTYLTFSAMEADTSQDIGRMGQVTNDPDLSKNGYYVWNGSSWLRSIVQPANSADVFEARGLADNALVTALSKSISGWAPIMEKTDSPNEYFILDSAGRIVGGPDVAANLQSQIDEISSGEKEVFIRITYGQSNSLGTITGETPNPLYVNNPWPTTLLMPNNGIRVGLSRQSSSTDTVDINSITSFVPLKSQPNSTGGQSTTIAEGAAYQLQKYLETVRGSAYPAVCVNLGWGARTIEQLSEAPLFDDAVAVVQRLAELIRAMGLNPVVEYVDFDQGEGNARDTDWADKLVSLRDAMNTQFFSITGQATDIPWLIAQVSSFYASGETGEQAMQAYELCKERPFDFVLTGPSYHTGYVADLLHRDEHSHALKGEFNAACLIRSHYLRMDNPVFIWDSIHYDSVTKKIKLYPSLPVERDEEITDPGNWGFDVYDGIGDVVAISKVEIVDGGNCIEITLATAPSAGSMRRVTCAINSRYSGTRTNYNDRPRSQIRARKPFSKMVLDGSFLWAYAPHSREIF